MIFKSVFEDSPPPAKFKESLSEFYWHQLDVYANKVLFVDYVSGREWTGAAIKREAHRIGRYLVDKLNIVHGDTCVTLYKNCDFAQVLSMGILFAGASTCQWHPADTAKEHRHVLDCARPKVVFAEADLYKRLVELRAELGLGYKICVMDDQEEQPVEVEELEPSGPVVGFSRHILSYEPPPLKQQQQQFPAQVEPDDGAYLLFTSGSTGLPKLVNRSHRNSINVCYSFRTATRLWDLNEQSVIAGFQELDHGTGTFITKMTIANGCKNIVMNGFDQGQLLDCIERHRVTDFNIGTAYLHNLMQHYCQAAHRPDLSSLRNIVSIGAPLHSHTLKAQFMDLLPGVSVRQAYGMTECGFVSLVARDEARTDTSSVGYLLPSAQVKIVDRATGKEVEDYDREGELCVRGPTVSPGYMNAPASDQARFQQPDGFYRTNDISTFGRDGRITIRGRYNEVLVFTDGWKVLPSEIETKLLEHPLIREAAVVGVPHPKLPGCHTPRAYVVPEPGAPLTERQVYEFVARDMSEPKHLNGGVRILDQLPRISVGKVDKKALRQLDGH